MADVAPQTIQDETEAGDVYSVRVVHALAYINRYDTDGVVRQYTVMHGGIALGIAKSEVDRLRNLGAVITVTLDDEGKEIPSVSEVQWGVPNVVVHDPDSPSVQDPGAVHPDTLADQGEKDLLDDDEAEDGLENLTKAQLEDLADAEGIEDVEAAKMNKSDMVEAIRKARRES